MSRQRTQANFAFPLIFILLSSCGVLAQESVSPDVAALLKRIDQLEQRVKTLEAEQAPTTITAPAPALMATSSSAPALMATAPSPANTQSSSSTMAGMDSMGMATPEHRFGHMTVQGFADVGWTGTHQSDNTNSFYLGQMNLFITSRLTDTSGIIAETVFESNDENAYSVELERLLFNYAPSDYFNMSVGRFHTSIGYYNTAYHHSTWMQTAMDRPFLFAFEDDGGILPIHNVGVSLTGKVPSGSLGLHYIAELGNGRTSRSPLLEPVQNVIDENNRKSTNFGLYVRPQAVRGLQAGIGWYNDRLMPNGMPRIGENIYSAYAVYQTSKFEFQNEVVLVRHAVDGGRTYNTPGWYTQISPQLHHVRPYFRYQYLNANASEPIYQDVGLNHGPSVGLRFNISEFAAFKIQYDHGMYRSQPGTNGLGTQLSFAF